MMTRFLLNPISKIWREVSRKALTDPALVKNKVTCAEQLYESPLLQASIRRQDEASVGYFCPDFRDRRKSSSVHMKSLVIHSFVRGIPLCRPAGNSRSPESKKADIFLLCKFAQLLQFVLAPNMLDAPPKEPELLSWTYVGLGALLIFCIVPFAREIQLIIANQFGGEFFLYTVGAAVLVVCSSATINLSRRGLPASAYLWLIAVFCLLRYLCLRPAQ